MINKEYATTLVNRLQANVDDLHRCGRPEVAFDLQETAICLSNAIESADEARAAAEYWHKMYNRIVNWLNIIGGVTMAALIVWVGAMILQAAGAGV